ncbi:MAG: methylmalonyl-CoA epimerase [Gemmatimonadetes bacterium]|nr:methylmalonyl-CoA epimerase [Gemmatimonadota bacterium]
MNRFPLDHVAVAVASIEEARALFELVTGEACSPMESIESQGVKVAFVGTVELLEPTDPQGAVARFLERRGSGLHHVAFRVPDLESALSELAAAGIRLIDEVPRIGARGHRVAFLHPDSTQGTLIELVQSR